MQVSKLRYTRGPSPDIGLKESECGQMGVMRIDWTEGCTMDDPAAKAYAVLPVGVEMIKPSPYR